MQQQRYPKQFQNMSDEFEVALWVSQHQRILNLAIDIRDAKSITIPANEDEFGGSQIHHTSISYPISTTLPEINQVW